MNKQLSHNQITDNIYEREGHRYEEMYQLYIADKIAYEKRKNVSSVDVLGQKKKIQAMTEKGDKLKAMQEEFAAQSYFQYISMNNVIPQVNKLEINRQKLRGQFKVHIAQRIPFNEKVNAFANEELSYYLYQKGIMMKQLSKKNQKGKEKSVFDKIQHRLKLLKLKEQKIDLIDQRRKRKTYGTIEEPTKSPSSLRKKSPLRQQLKAEPIQQPSRNKSIERERNKLGGNLETIQSHVYL